MLEVGCVQQIGTMNVETVGLTIDEDFKLVIVHESDGTRTVKSKRVIKYAQAILISYKGTILIVNYIDIMYFKNCLKLYTSRGLVSKKSNPYFKQVRKKGENSLMCIFDETRYLDTVDAMTILDMMHQTLVNFDNRRLFTNLDSVTDFISPKFSKSLEKMNKTALAECEVYDEDFVDKLIAEMYQQSSK